MSSKKRSSSSLPSDPAHYSSNWKRFKTHVKKPVSGDGSKLLLLKNWKPTTVGSAAPSGTGLSTKYSRMYKGVTKAIAIDCEMVGVGFKGSESVLARVSLVNENGFVLYDKYVKPIEKVTDFRSAVSGIYPHHLEQAEPFKLVQKEVSDITKDKVLVGHSINNDLRVLFLSHPRHLLRDTARYPPFRKMCNGRTPSLKKLANLLLGVVIQDGAHSSVQDAQVVMKIYKNHCEEWETSLR